MSPAKVPNGETRGWIIPIGGGEKKEDNPVILDRFVQLCGGRDAHLMVIPTASKLEETGDRYRRLFTELGAGEVSVLDFDTRRDIQPAHPGSFGRLPRGGQDLEAP